MYFIISRLYSHITIVWWNRYSDIPAAIYATCFPTSSLLVQFETDDYAALSEGRIENQQPLGEGFQFCIEHKVSNSDTDGEVMYLKKWSKIAWITQFAPPQAVL